MDPSLLEPHEKLIRIVILGRVFMVPENNLLLRQMQYLADDIGYGRYCWNAECRYCEISYTQNGGAELAALACRIKGLEGMAISKVAPEIKYNMADALAAAPREEG
jgi:hypothetical protein